MSRDEQLGEGAGEIILYQTEDGQTRIDVRMEADTIWLSQRQMADLYQVDVRTVNHHVKGIISDGEVDSEATIQKYRIVQTEGGREVTRLVEHYSLDMILAVGYRVRSQRGAQFRRWATEVLTEYLRKGFAMNDDLLKKAGGGAYWKELLERIRDNRSRNGAPAGRGYRGGVDGVTRITSRGPWLGCPCPATRTDASC